MAEPLKHSFPDLKYVRARVVAIDTAGKTITARAAPADTLANAPPTSADGPTTIMPYDLLLLGIGARNNTFGIPGVEQYMHFLKELADARAIRSRIIKLFETASFDSVPQQERERLLSFVIVGGGPTGVEFAAELHDFLIEDVARVYPQLMPLVRITIVEGRSILGSFDASLREYTERKFRRDRITIRTGANVTAVTPREVVLSDGTQLPFGLGVWNTGIGPRPLIASLDARVWRKDRWGHINTNDYLQCLAALPPAPPGTSPAPAATAALAAGSEAVIPGVYAMGDCAAVAGHGYAATAQVAAQQGKFLARHLNHTLTQAKAAVAQHHSSVALMALDPAERRRLISQEVLHLTTGATLATGGRKPFVYRHVGSLAFVGTFTAISDFTASSVAPLHGTRLRGWVAWFLWRSAYLTDLGSWMKRVQVPLDWLRTFVFGRDITSF